MLENNNIGPFLLAWIPTLLYSLLVWLSMPAGSVKLKISSLYFFMGILSVFVVQKVHYIFPFWTVLLGSNMAMAVLIRAFFQVAFLEESSKFILFKITDSYRYRHWLEHPSATMFYGMSIGAGFAVAENFDYADIFGTTHEAAYFVLTIRMFSSVLAHMTCGLIMGYFVGRGKSERASITQLGQMNPFLRKLIYYALALGAAMFFHGVYDFNLMFNEEPLATYVMFSTLLLGFGITYLMAKETKQDKII